MEAAAETVEAATEAMLVRLARGPWRFLRVVAWPFYSTGFEGLVTVASRRQRIRWWTPLPDDQVRSLFPESVIDWDEE